MKFILEHTGAEFPRLVVVPENADEANQLVNKWAEETGFGASIAAKIAEKVGR